MFFEVWRGKALGGQNNRAAEECRKLLGEPKKNPHLKDIWVLQPNHGPRNVFMIMHQFESLEERTAFFNSISDKAIQDWQEFNRLEIVDEECWETYQYNER